MAAAKPVFICASCARAIRSSSKPSTTSRALSSSTRRAAPEAPAISPFVDRRLTPRWKQTPPAMKMPFRLRELPNQPRWEVNEDPELLDKAMDQFFGDSVGVGIRGRDVLSEETKWLSVTHKSFEQGARGFNDRIAFLGRRIVDLEASKALLEAPTAVRYNAEDIIQQEEPIGPLRNHPALDGIENISPITKKTLLATQRVIRLANQYGITKVVRWKPRQVEKLGTSGIEVIITHAMYAIIGAVALERGGKVANEVARQRILAPLGLR